MGKSVSNLNLYPKHRVQLTEQASKKLFLLPEAVKKKIKPTPLLCREYLWNGEP
jgi:hypothetical protein